ncbi:MAG TPA: aminotransferase class V-fold PLP-dependent enzyme [Vicinamibacteria bacterium]|nr:aminotransferase class V-fold PLP-dependent enzyme [Vicinamibacteria bacterium]
MTSAVASWRERIIGLDARVPLLDGRTVPYVNLDNAATTPPLRDVVEAVQRFLPFYGSVHRSTGYKSRLSTAAYDEAHRTVARFVGADPDTAAVVFGKNTTEAINKLAHRYPLPEGAVVVTTLMEHHSNDLPWRGRAQLVRVGLLPDGRLDEEHLDRLLALHAGRIALLTVSGASNVTGFVQPVHRLARKAHAVGARILVDAAQWAPHRPIDVRPVDHPEHLDYVVLSAHKLYAPFGTGALVGRPDIFLSGAPEYRGGGTIDLVWLDEVEWAGLPHREEAGSPNVVGAVALAAAASALLEAGLDALSRHEQALTAYALERLASVPGLTLYGDADPSRVADRVGVIPFNLAGFHDGLVAAILGHEVGIGVRHGCFCAQAYVAHLLGIPEAVRRRLADRKPGMVRISFGVYNTPEDVDALVEALLRIGRGEYRGRYALGPDGEYAPAGPQKPFVIPVRMDDRVESWASFT